MLIIRLFGSLEIVLFVHYYASRIGKREITPTKNSFYIFSSRVFVDAKQLEKYLILTGCGDLTSTLASGLLMVDSSLRREVRRLFSRKTHLDTVIVKPVVVALEKKVKSLICKLRISIFSSSFFYLFLVIVYYKMYKCAIHEWTLSCQ